MANDSGVIMQQPVSFPLQLVEHDTICPDLLNLEIHLAPVESPDISLDGSDGADRRQVVMSLATGSYWKQIAGGRVQVAIAQAYLTLELQNTTFSSVKDDALIGHSITVRQFPNSIPRFELVPSEGAILEASINNLPLGMLHIGGESSPVAVTAAVTMAVTVAIAPRDVRILTAEGLWRHDITPNKHGIIERTLARAIADADLLPYLSRIQFGHSYSAVSSSPTSHPLDDTGLRTIITTIIDAPTSNLLDLAAHANLLVETDLAGAQLRGASLSRLDLSGVDLSYANLRGADLTDAELSEANLSYAKLGGADLSGADLGSATLQNADLHRASLALANLSGADLSHANLCETNLSQANLNGVHVDGALFSQNSGLTDETVRALVEKGARVENT